MPGDLGEEELQAHFAALPLRYFQIHSAEETLDDLRLAHRFMRRQILEEKNLLAPVVNWHDEPDRGYNAVTICTWDRAGLFGKIAGSFSAAGLNILSARIFTRSDGIALDTFFVTDARTGSLATGEQRDGFENLLYQVLTGVAVDLPGLIARKKIAPLYQAYSGERLPTLIRFDNEASETRTIVEIETEDRVGLLYTMAQTLTEAQLDISGARICTERGAAIDSFYVHEMNGAKVISPERQQIIESELRHAIDSLDSAG
jgi:[protein-PII] uridylyltransferase